MKLCSHCGRALNDRLSVCPDDGTKLAAPSQILRGAPASVPVNSNLRHSEVLKPAMPLSVKIGAGAAAVLLGVAIAFFLSNPSIFTGPAKPDIPSVDQLIEAKQYNKAVEILESWKKDKVQTPADEEKLDGLLFDMAEVASQDNKYAEALALLGKIGPKSVRYEEAQKALQRLQKQHKLAKS